MTGAGAATAAAVVAVVAVAVDFLVVFLGAVAELDICISVFEEVFGAYKRGNDDGN
jgi:predicted membrane-bound dolichyl-phosphate-mannose-protein mannosyltransferase